jgi:hypothetical protein
MMMPRRLPWMAAICFVIAGSGTAAAQSVFVRHAPAGRAIEVRVNRQAAGQGTADENGDARVPFTLQATAGKAEMDANVFVDVCADVTRVIVMEAGRTPAAPDVGCERRDVQGLYAVRTQSTLVVNVSSVVPSMLLIQGDYTPPKPGVEGETPEEGGPMRPATGGLSLTAGGTFTSIRDAATNACGNVSECKPDDKGLGYMAGGIYWITKWLGAEAGYLRPAQIKATRTGDVLQFDSTMKTDIVFVAGKLAIPAGPVRIFGTFGADYHQATMNTSETIEARTTTDANNVSTTIPGGSQTFELKTKGWSYMYGGGGEIWVSRPLALFGELNIIKLRGKPVGAGEAGISDRLTSLNFGVRIHVGG